MTKSYTTFSRIFFTIGIAFSVLSAQFVEDVFDRYTSVGQLGLTVTNFGLLGNGWNKIDGKILPSCQYKQHTEILREQVEHFSYAGLWVGGIVNGDRRVSTAIVDGVFESGQEGFEFFPTSGIETRSSISSTALDSMAQYYSPYAVSHQDLLTDFKDYGVTPNDDNGIPNHLPLGVNIHLESYAWNFSFADAFVILNYTITNASNNTIEDLYVGIWTDASVGNMNYTDYYTPGGGWTWYDNLDGFDQSLDASGFTRDIAYQYDYDGDDGWAESYIGITLLGGSVPRPYVKSYYNQWVWTNSNNTDYPSFSMPLIDFERYEKLSSSVQRGNGPEYTNEGYPNSPNSWLFLVSAGPLGSRPATADSSHWILPPGESCNVVFAVATARWNGTIDDSPERRANLHVNVDWAQKAYDGEDKNRDNILEEDEDLNGNGVIDRYILPEPPPVPNMTLDVGDREVTIYWQNNAENFIDPISRQKDFEGYRIYGARKTVGDEKPEFTLLGEFDKRDPAYPNIGYNTGFDLIRIKNEFGEPDSVEINGRYYHYRFVNSGVKNGWLNYYAVTAYDRGDPDANLESLESSVYANRKYVYPGVKPAVGDWQGEVRVYPNPYRGQAKWDGYGSRDRMIWFQNLPPKAEIRIFTLAGDLVDILYHDAGYSGSDIQNIDENKSPVFSGGEHAWDLITRYDQAAATGLYLFTVENRDPNSGAYKQVKEGKFLIIK
ncbi:MAG: hypothetical protein GXO90_12005 [FCB group bacterium]|nr:hypothetical protein [FCB group bacterium]